MVGEVAGALDQLVSVLSPRPEWLAVGVVADLVLGDPVYAWHPVRLCGRLLTWTEGRLRVAGLDGYGGGILLFVALAIASIGSVAVVMLGARSVSTVLPWIVHLFLVYSLLALGDLLWHVWRIEKAVRSGDLARARLGVSALAGRDTDVLDGPACRRAGVESLGENLTDGFVSPLFWYVLAGLPGLVLFKVVSTMDSMVGYKTPRYLRFGWCGARLDDVMNYVPARLTFLVVAAVAALLPGYSGLKALRVGHRQHGLLLGPNAGWSEAALAGAVERRLVGPIWLNGVRVTDVWLGEASDPPLETAADVVHAMTIAVLSGLVVAGLGIACLMRPAAWPASAHVNPGTPVRIVLTLPEDFAGDRCGIAFPKREELQQIRDGVALGPAEVGVRLLPRRIA
jgi:adenosylcobinamide-phosphate synthase